MSEIREYWLRLGTIKGLGWRRLELLREFFGSIEEVWNAAPESWLKLGVSNGVVEEFARQKGSEIAVPDYKFVCIEDEEYPERLKNIPSPPVLLFYEGDISICNNKVIAVVGTRRLTEYGRRATRMFVGELTSKDYVVVSGLARGVDSVAHEWAIKNKGKTAAVLAHGLDMTYPPENEKLRRRIVETGGVVLSEYVEGVKPTRQQFAVRDRIVAGLADAVLVTEAPRKSGTKITVGFAAEQGKDVFVVPGPIDYPTYEGSVEIMRDGGVPVVSPTELVSSMG